MLKRGLSLLLALMMMLTLVTPVYAEAIEGQTTIKLKIRPQQGEWKYIEKTYSGRDNSTYYAVELYAETDEETFKLSGAQFYLNFDKDVLEFRTLKSTDDDSIKYDEEDSENALNVTQPTPSECNSKGYVPLILSCNTNHVLKSGITLVTAVFTVKQNAESGIANFTLAAPENAEKETMCSFNVTENGKPVVTSHTVDDSATATITINGVAPELDYVEVTDTTGVVLAHSKSETEKYTKELRLDAVTLDSNTSHTYFVKAYSKKGTDITNQVQWSISHNQTETVGAQLDETDKENKIVKVTIPEKGGSPKGVTLSEITAMMPEAETSKTARILYRRANSIPTSANISLRGGSSASLQVPGTNAADVTAQFDAVVYDQFGEDITRTALGSSCKWYVESANAGSTSPKGISIVYNTGLLTVKSDALSTVQNGNTSYTVYIQADQASGGKRVGTYLITVSLSDRVPTSVEISGGPEGSTLAVPTTDAPNATATYTATVYDQYGDVIADPGTIRWYLEADGESEPFGTGNESQFIVMKEFAQTFAEGSTRREITIKAICGDASGTTTLTLTRQPAEVTRIVIEGIHSAALCKVPTMDDNENFEHALTVKKIDQYGVTTEAAANEVTWDKLSVLGVTLQNGTLTIQPAAAGNDFTTDKYGNLVYSFNITATYSESGKSPVTDTKTITLTRQPPVATAIAYGTGMTNPVVPTNETPVSANVTLAVVDQYGVTMNSATVEPDGDLPVGFVWQEGSLRVTKAAVAHFDGERKASVDVNVGLRCKDSPTVRNTAKVTLELEAAQINASSAEISGQTSIAKPTGEQTNTAEYSISDVIRDQYGLRMQNVDRSKLSLKLYSDAACGNEVTNGTVMLSGKTITVTSGAEVDTKYYLKAYYNDQPCSDAKTITITNKQEGARLTVVQDDITYGTAVSPSVSNKPAGAGTITYTYVGRDGTTYNSSDAPTNAGKYTVTATCEDATHIYTGSVDFQILPKQIKVGWIELDGTRYTYNGQQQTVKYTVKDGNTTLVKDRDYTVEGDKQTNAGVHLLKIIGKGNYTSDPTGAPSVNWDIWELPVRINTATFQSRGYAKDNYSAVLETLTLVAENGSATPDTLTAGTGFTVSDIRVTNNNAGQQPVIFKVTLTNNNYKWAAAETGNIFNVPASANYKVTINKIDHRAEAVSAEGKYGNQLSVDLSQVLPEGWSATAVNIADTNGVLTTIHGANYIMETDGKLWLQLTDDSDKVGKSATVTLTVESTNYNPFTITVTVTVQGKETQTITASDLNVTYGDAGVKLNASALDNAKLAYEVIEGTDVIAVDANGNVTLLKSGTAKIRITAAETEDYGVGTKLVTVAVAKRSLTVKANDLTAYVGGQLPALDYTVTGLTSGDMLTVLPELELKDVPAGVDPMKTAGTYTIGFKTLPAADTDKYDLTVETGTLTISSRPNVNPVPAGNSVKLEEAAGGKLTSSVSRATKGTTVTITVKPDAGYQLEELEVLGKNGESLPLKELANGKFSFQMPDSKVTVQASFVQESTYAGYPDVLPQDWFYSSVRYVTERGLMNGTPNGFEPNMDSSRATIWTILARFSGVDTTVVSGEWYAVARQWAMENGVSDGTNPNGVITREQLATMLYRFAKNKGLVQEPVTADLSVFVDAGQISDYALDAMRWAVSVGLLNGMDGSRLAPQGSAARAQVAAMLMRFDQLAK